MYSETAKTTNQKVLAFGSYLRLEQCLQVEKYTLISFNLIALIKFLTYKV